MPGLGQGASVLSTQGGAARTDAEERGVLSNKGMKLTRVGAGAERRGRSATWPKVAAQLMPGVLRTYAEREDGGASHGRG